MNKVKEVNTMYQNFMPCPDSMYKPFSRRPMHHVDEIMLIRAYIPDQPYIGLLPLDKALEKGTIFPNLVVPFPYER